MKYLIIILLFCTSLFSCTTHRKCKCPHEGTVTFEGVKMFSIYDTASYQEIKEPKDSIIIICAYPGKDHTESGKAVLYRSYDLGATFYKPDTSGKTIFIKRKKGGKHI